MKKTIIYILTLTLVIVTAILTFYKNDNSSMDKITVAEVTHSVFYTPWYVAIEKGFFAEENIEIDLILTSGADKVSAALLSNDVQIGFAGPESSIYVYNGGESDYLVSFAGLTKRDGQFIVAREKDSDFKLEDLYGKEVLAGRVGGMPILNFENALKTQSIDKNKININTNVDFASLSGSFIAGIGDYVNLFEPNATKLEEQGLGYVVASIGKLSGEVPYTTFLARKSYLENNEDLIKRFVKALNKGIEYTFNNDDEKLAQIISPQFPDSSIEEITRIIKRYREADSWFSNTYISKESFENLEEMMINADMIPDYVPYDYLIKNISYE